MVFLQARAQAFGDLRIPRVPRLGRLDFPDGLRDLAQLAGHGPGRPIALADLVQHGPANADPGESLELRTMVRGVIAARLQQTDHAGLNQIVDLDGGWQTPNQVIGDSPDQRRVLFDDSIFRAGLDILPECGARGHQRDPHNECRSLDAI